LGHLLAVASLVLEFGGDRDEAVAALLHDAIEDGENPGRVRRQIAERFGKRVLAIVEGCTDTDVKPKPKWRPRKDAYLAHFAEVPRSVALVAAADKLHNLRSILADYGQLGQMPWPRFKGRPPALVRELMETIAALEREVRRTE
jgi:(p)ppGpp synthase/HD superfamily hydrolase